MNFELKKEVVLERLAFINEITILNDHLHDPNRIFDVGENGWSHPWMYFDSLRNYLLITCFDILGSSDEWVTYTEWLTSKTKEKERDDIKKSILENFDTVEIASHFYDEYQKIYGVKTSIKNFFNNVIDDAVRESILSSIWIRECEKPAEPNASSTFIREITNPKDKINFLIELRSGYTHKGINTGSPAGGVFKNIGGPFISPEGKEQHGYVPIHWKHKNNRTFLEYSVRRWPNIMIEAIESVVN